MSCGQLHRPTHGAARRRDRVPHRGDVPGGRTVDLFTENFLDPLAARALGIDRFWVALPRLWSLSLVFNLAGGVALALILTTEGALPEDRVVRSSSGRGDGPT